MSTTHSNETTQPKPRKDYINLFLEYGGTALSVIYVAALAAGAGWEILVFALLGLSAGLFFIWAIRIKARGFMTLQIFYFTSAVYGLYNVLSG